MSASTIATTLLMASPALIDSGLRLLKFAQSRQETPKRTQGALRHQVSPIPEFDVRQRQALRIMAQEVYRAPLPPALARARPALILALLVNAWFESRLNPKAFNGRGESSVGLFQINQRAHPGHAKEDLQDAGYNTRTFLALIVKQADQYEPLLRQGASIHTLAAAITLWTERPKDKKIKAVQRARTLAAWFPFTKKTRALDWKP